MCYLISNTRANTYELGLQGTQRPHMGGKKLKNRNRTKRRRDLCSFGSTGECPSSYIIALVIPYLYAMLNGMLACMVSGQGNC